MARWTAPTPPAATWGARTARLHLVGDPGVPARRHELPGAGHWGGADPPDCVLISADTESGAVLLTRQLAAAMPDVKIFGTAGLAESTYADPTMGGIPLSVDPHVILTAPTLALSEYPASARSVMAAYERRFGTPEPDSILGYEAMSLMLNAITRATDNGSRPRRALQGAGRDLRHAKPPQRPWHLQHRP